MIRCIIQYDGRKVRIMVDDTITVATLIIKIRNYLKLIPEEAIFLFFQGEDGEKLYPNSKPLQEIASDLRLKVLQINVCKESTFGEMDKRFVKAVICELAGGNAWSLRITYSFYGLYEYCEVWVYKTQLECERRLSIERCRGYLTIKNKNGEVLSIDPSE